MVDSGGGGGELGVASHGRSATVETPLHQGYAGDFTDLENESGDPSPDREHRIELHDGESSEPHDSDLESHDHRMEKGSDTWNDSRRGSVSDLNDRIEGDTERNERRGANDGVLYAETSTANVDTIKNNTNRPIGPRAWLRINEEGVCTPVTIDKHRLAQHLGVPMRDFRMLEPNRSDSYSAAILCRERCIVMHIEQVRLLITSENIFMQDGPRSYTVMKILPELQRRLLMRKLKLMDGRTVPNIPNDGEQIPGLENEPVNVSNHSSDAEGAGNAARFKQKMSNLGLGTDGKAAPVGVRAMESSVPSTSSNPIKKEKQKKKGSKKNLKIPGDDESDDDEFSPSGSRRSRDRMRSLSSRDNEETLPFELVGLEVALEIVCNTLERDRRDVGEEVRASLAGLRKKVDTFNLERVRRVKSKVTRLTGRVAKVREEIKRYLDDDSDMRDMYLTRKALVEANAVNNPEQMTGSGDYSAYRMGRPSVNFGNHLNRDFIHGSGGSFKMRRQSLNFGSDGVDGGVTGTGGGSNTDAANQLKNNSGNNPQPFPQTPGNQQNIDSDLFGDEVYIHQEDSDLQVVEDLLETYFAHIDSTYAELDAIDQFINDTEDFVNIQLDVTRNQLQKFEVTLTSATLFVSMYSMVGGIYGMNLKNGTEDSHSTFVLVNILCSVGGVFGFGMIMLYIRSKKWM
mgnify:CR=1 FL=1